MNEQTEYPEDPSLATNVSAWLVDLTTRPETGTATQSRVPWQPSEAEILKSQQDASLQDVLKGANPSLRLALDECHLLTHNPENFSSVMNSLADSMDSGIRTIASHMNSICPAPRRQYLTVTALILAGKPDSWKHTLTPQDEKTIRSQIRKAWKEYDRDDKVQQLWKANKETIVSGVVACFRKAECHPIMFGLEDYSRITRAVESGFEGEGKWVDWKYDLVLGDAKHVADAAM